MKNFLFRFFQLSTFHFSPSLSSLVTSVGSKLLKPFSIHGEMTTKISKSIISLIEIFRLKYYLMTSHNNKDIRDAIEKFGDDDVSVVVVVEICICLRLLLLSFEK
jgi:hypothetical protein